MHILAISGSLRASSTNTTLMRATTRLAPEGMTFTIYDGLGDLPHFSPDLDGDEAPPAVDRLRRLLQDADGVLICTPEYAFGVPGSLKNALDWTVSSGEFMYKPTVAISASPSNMGGDKAHASLLLTLQAETAEVVNGGALTIPRVNKVLDADGNIADDAIAQALRTALASLAQAIAHRAAEEAGA